MGLSREESFHCLGQLNSDLLPRRLFTWLENQCCYLLGAQLELRVGCGREGSKSFHMSFPWPVSASSWHSDKVLRVSVSRGQEVVKPFIYWFWKSPLGVAIVAQQVKNPTSIHKDVSSTPDLAQWVKDLALPQVAG